MSTSILSLPMEEKEVFNLINQKDVAGVKKILEAAKAEGRIEKIFKMRDKDGLTPLMCGVRSCTTEIVDQLLDVGANPDERDAIGGTALMQAVYIGHTNIIKSLIKKNADTEAKDKDGKTPMYWACNNESLDIIELLREADDNLKYRVSINDGKIVIKDEQFFFKLIFPDE